MKKIVNSLGSLKLTLPLLLLLAGMAALGTFLPRGTDTQGWEELLGRTGARVAASAGLTDFYHSPWFGLLLIGLSVNLAACMTSRVPGMRSAVKGEAALARAPVLEAPEDGAAADRLKDALSRLGFREGRRAPGRLYNRWAARHLFVLFTHVSLLIIMLSSVAGSTFGFIVTKRVYVGETTETAFSWKAMEEVPLPFTVRADDLVVVANPVGVRLGVLNVPSGTKGKLITTHEGATFTVPGLIGRVTVERFDIEEKSFTARWSGSPEKAFGPGEEIGGTGLALVPVAFATWPEKQVVASVTVLAEGLAPLHREISINHPFVREGVRIYLTDYGRDRFGLAYVGFQFVRDPGQAGVWAGCVLFLVCACGAVFTSHSCAVVVREGGRLRVHLSSRGDRDEIAGKLRDALERSGE